jgi:phosphoglycerate dehydrogenase-like enzyme
MKRVLVLAPVLERHKKLLQEAAPSAEFVYADRETVADELVLSAEIIIGVVENLSILKDAKKLEWYQWGGAGFYDYMLKEGVLPENIKLTTSAGCYSVAIAECMFAVLLALCKDLHIYRDMQLGRKWDKVKKSKENIFSALSVYKSTSLIIGAGNIGEEFAKRLKAFGSYTIGIKRTKSAKPEFFDEMHQPDALEELLPRADIVGMCVPETDQTRHLINEKTLKLMKKTAVLINAGRGSAVDENALRNALEKGELRGAALDVFSVEPLPEDSPLWKVKNLIVTPHCFGWIRIPETLERMVSLYAENLSAYFNGKSLKNEYKPGRGY